MGNELRATYRVQLHDGFGFSDAAAIAGYLAQPGVSHLYCSPYLQAVPEPSRAGEGRLEQRGSLSDSKEPSLQGTQTFIPNILMPGVDAMAANSEFDGEMEHRQTGGIVEVASASYLTIVMDTSVPPFDNKKVRQALQAATDRQVIRQAALLGRGEIANENPIPPMTPTTGKSRRLPATTRRKPRYC